MDSLTRLLRPNKDGTPEIYLEFVNSRRVLTALQICLSSSDVTSILRVIVISK